MAPKGYECTLDIGALRIGKCRVNEPRMESVKQDITTRDSADFDEGQQGRKSMTFTLEALWIPTNAGIQALHDAYFSGDDVTFEILDAQGFGWSGRCRVQNMGTPQNLEDAVMISVDCYATGTFIEVTGSSSSSSSSSSDSSSSSSESSSSSSSA